MTSPSVRLAMGSGTTDTAFQKYSETKPDIRLAVMPGGIRESRILSKKGVSTGPSFDLPSESWPGILVSYVYLSSFRGAQDKYRYRDWVLDSGAYTAFKSGNPIDNEQFLDVAFELATTDPTLSEVFALDVIGDYRASLANCERAWECGIRAIPTFHIGEHWEYLEHIATNYPKIALGGVADLRGNKKMQWAAQCFSRVWPKKIHGFGFGSVTQIMGLPWHSVDASNWATGALRFGRWQSLGPMSIRGSNQNLRAEIEHYLKLERQVRTKWRREMELLETTSPTMPLLISET